MADYAHSETDKRIAELEKRLSEEYRQAYKETKGKLEKYLSDFKRKDEKKRQEVDNGTLSEKEYKTWRRNQMLTGQRWADMVDTLTKDLNNVNIIAAQIVRGELPETFALNANYSSYQIENGYRQNFGFTLYDRDTVDRLVSENPDLLPEPSVDIPADRRWNKQKITSNITQAVLQGKSIPEIAKSMQTVVGMNKASAVRNARTAMTGAQNAGRQQAYERAAKMGIKLQKEWMATLDGRTRHSHGMADGQKVDINGMFSVGGCKMRYPGDVQNGTAAEIYNCRCTMCTVEPPEIMQGEEPRMTYSEWVKTKEGQEATGGKFAEKPLDKLLEQKVKSVEMPQAKTIEEAQAYAKKLGVEYPDYSKFTIERANNMNKALSTLPDDSEPYVVTDLQKYTAVTGAPLDKRAKNGYACTVTPYEIDLKRAKIADTPRISGSGDTVVAVNTKTYKTLDSITESKARSEELIVSRNLGKAYHFNTDGKATDFHECGHVYASKHGLPMAFSADADRWYRETGCELLKSPSEAWAEAYAAYYTHADDLPSYIRRYFDNGEWKINSGSKVLALDEWYKKLLDNDGGSGIMNTTTNAVGHTVIITDKNSLKGPPNGITQTTNSKGGIDRNYYDSNGDQTKQITNHDHSHKAESKLGKHGEHAHDYAFNDEGKNVHGKPRELSDEERKENADIL